MEKCKGNRGSKAMNLSGSVLAGGRGRRDRVEHDFYATPVPATLELLAREEFKGKILEPACGQGHIMQAVKLHAPLCTVEGTDIVQREDVFNLGVRGGVDFLTAPYKPGEYDHIITNPPFSLVQEFIKKSLDVAAQKVGIFCKIQLLEGKSRKELFEKSPLKTVYVFSGRVSTLFDGRALNEKGKPWASTMCFAWFVWDKRYKGEPSIRWI
jgi:hypothetical protein